MQTPGWLFLQKEIKNMSFRGDHFYLSSLQANKLLLLYDVSTLLHVFAVIAYEENVKFYADAFNSHCTFLEYHRACTE